MKYFATFALAAVATPAFAQVAPGADEVVGWASQIAGNVDHGFAATVWDRADTTLKTGVPKDRFVSQIAQKQQRNGTPVTRVWSSIVRSTIAPATGSTVQRPLITVTFIVTSNRNTTYNETVQFTTSADKSWRLVNYIN